MSFLGAMRKRRAIRGYVRKLPRLLRVDYGFSPAYTPHQIRATIERHGLNRGHSAYAIAMFSDPAGFAQFHESTGEHYDYEALRDEIAAVYFDANANFTVWDAMHAFPDASGDGSHYGTDGPGGHGDGGGSH